ncbi:alanine dehydrogenase [Ferrimicrobium sp.]|uniref:alanine dehydrogenase n=1 Tax=Ferrimicrobium sp. TaxID=2926050 RepID=UPI0026376AA7|nr:alanine dehydrogenase [Ferrimicrobium sp.]
MVQSIGLPKEIKDGERRVALDPSAVKSCVQAGFDVWVETNAGVGAGFANADYEAVGAKITPDAKATWAADLVVKVKEPQESEWGFFRKDLTLFAYLHLAAEPALAKALADSGIDAFAYETLEEKGGLPLLAPMSEVAGRTAAIVGAHYLASGSGVLLGGSAGVPPARVVVIGMGVAGTMAARGARGMDAEVTGVDIDLHRLYMAQQEGTVTATLASSEHAISEAVREADLVVGAALVTGAKAPKLVLRDHIASMRPGSVVVDLAIDQGGCIETSRPTSHSEPIYEELGVIHYCVTNVPGQYPKTASRALSAAVAPKLVRLARDPQDPVLTGSLNVAKGEIVHPVVAKALGL